MNVKRPVNLDLTQFHFPPMAIVSITHRITGVILFLAMPLLIYILQETLASPSCYAHLQQTLHYTFMKLALWAILASVSFHFFAGIRHLIMDLGYGEELVVSRLSAYAIFLLEIMAIVLLGVWIW